MTKVEPKPTLRCPFRKMRDDNNKVTERVLFQAVTTA